MNGKNIVVTGGAGFIGSNLVRVLAKKNQVVVVDDLSTGHLENIKDLIDRHSIDFVKGSVANLKILQKAFLNVDYVFHLAAVTSIPRSIIDPYTTNKVNINGTLNVLISALNNNVKKVIFASSCAIYGNPSKIPIKESTSPDPLSPYAISKLTGEYFCQFFNNVLNLPTVTLRYFNVYGPRQGFTGEYSTVIPKFISRILDNKPPIIYGDGKQTRDFFFVSDTVRANILAAKNEVSGVFNIASGKKLSIINLAKDIMGLMGKNLKPVYEKSRIGDIRHSFADISKAKIELNFEPKFSLNEGLKETLNWFLE